MQIPYGSEAGEQRASRVYGRSDGVVGDIPVKLIDELSRAGLDCEVCMTID
jgi:hypothetical protein